MIELVEAVLDEVLPKVGERPTVLHEAMRYAVGTGGKRLRPQLCLAACEVVGGTVEDAKYPAAAIELLHNYTLIHDDLPAMDNDRERRGQPTIWVKFGEANAILAGDALLALAYRTASRAPRNVPAVIDILGEMGVGVVQGQVEDVRSGGCEVGAVPFVYRHKTADLFIAAAKMGALAGGGSPTAVAALGDYAFNLGMAFQFEDDLLDGDAPYPQTATEQLIETHTAAAVASLRDLPGDTTFLKGFVEKLVGRKV